MFALIGMLLSLVPAWRTWWVREYVDNGTWTVRMVVVAVVVVVAMVVVVPIMAPVMLSATVGVFALLTTVVRSAFELVAPLVRLPGGR